MFMLLRFLTHRCEVRGGGVEELTLYSRCRRPYLFKVFGAYPVSKLLFVLPSPNLHDCASGPTYRMVLFNLKGLNAEYGPLV